MVEDGNKQGELKNSRKPGCFGPEEFRAGQSSATTGRAAGSPGIRGHGRSTGEPSAAGGERKQNCSRWSGFLLSWMDLGSRCRRPTLSRKPNKCSASRSCEGAEATVRAEGWPGPAPLCWPGRPAGCPGGGGAAEPSPPPLSAPWRGADSPISHVDASAAAERLRVGGRESEHSGSSGGGRNAGERQGQGLGGSAGSPSRRSWGAAGRRGGSPAPRARRHGGRPGPRGPARLPGLERAWWELPASPPRQWGILGCPKLLSRPRRPEAPGLAPAAGQHCPRPPGPGLGERPPARPGLPAPGSGRRDTAFARPGVKGGSLQQRLWCSCPGALL